MLGQRIVGGESERSSWGYLKLVFRCLTSGKNFGFGCHGEEGSRRYCNLRPILANCTGPVSAASFPREECGNSCLKYAKFPQCLMMVSLLDGRESSNNLHVILHMWGGKGG